MISTATSAESRRRRQSERAPVRALDPRRELTLDPVDELEMPHLTLRHRVRPSHHRGPPGSLAEASTSLRPAEAAASATPWSAVTAACGSSPPQCASPRVSSSSGRAGAGAGPRRSRRPQRRSLERCPLPRPRRARPPRRLHRRERAAAGFLYVSPQVDAPRDRRGQPKPRRPSRPSLSVLMVKAPRSRLSFVTDGPIFVLTRHQLDVGLEFNR